MADNKRYYYLKLKENFFDSEEMIILQSMQDGYLYSDILMKLYLRSLKNEGRLMFKDVIPYTPTVLATVVRHQVGTVEKALKIFADLGLIEVLDNGAIYMMEIQNFIGESSTEADRIRNYRNKIKQEKTIALPNCTNDITSDVTNVRQKYTRDRDRDRVKDKEKENKRKKERKKKETSYDEILSVIENEDLKELYYEYIKMRKLIKSPMTDRALKMLIGKVNDLEPTDINRQKQMLETAIMNNWKSVYELKDNNKTTNQSINNKKDDWKGYCKPPEDDPLPF